MKSERGMATGWAVLLLAALAQPAAAQDSGEVGPAELRDFQLRPQTAPVPEPGPRIAPLPQPPAEAPPAPPVAAEPAPVTLDDQPASSPPAPAPSRPRPATPAPPVADARQPDPVPTPAPEIVEPLAPAAPAPTAPLADAEQAMPAPSPPPSRAAAWWIPALGAALIGAGLLGVALFARRRRTRRPAPVAEVLAHEVIAPPPPPAPPEQRPWIEFAFRPARAAATEAQATVHYELTVRNTGDAVAEAVLIRSGLFSAGATEDAELFAFCRGEIEGEYVIEPLDIAPGAEVVLHAIASLPREAVRALTVEGRALFIPMVAFSAHYSWQGQHGHTANSYLVGRETAPPPQKMAPLRLDLGPRVYAAVGQRPGKLAMMS